MAYTIYKADGTPVVIPDNAVDTAYYNASGGTASSGQGIQLVGRNAINYGAPTAQNFLQMTENFASITSTQPADSVALQGQLWYDTALKLLYVRTNNNTSGGMANWQQVVTVNGSETGSIPVVNPSGPPSVGDIRVVGSIISIYANGAWQQIFPAVYS